MNDIFAALIIMSIWAIWIVAFSRWKYWLSVLTSLGAYVGAIVMMRAIGFAAVAVAWAAMSAASAIVDVTLDRTPVAQRKASPLASTLAAFVVGLIGWPFLCPGTRYPAKVVPLATPPPSATGATPIAGDDDDDAADAAENPQKPPARERTLAQRSGIANFVSDDFTFEREADGEPASLLDAAGSLQSFYESTVTSIVFRISATQLDSATLYGPASNIVATLLDRRTPPPDRDAAYALAASLARAYPGAIRVEDTLVGLGT